MVKGKFLPILMLVKTKWQATMPIENEQPVNFVNSPRDAQRDDGKRAIKSFFFEQGKGRETG
jgi:hypothetical protein